MKKRVGIVTTWFERGASYVSRQFRDVINEQHEVFIYARGEEYAQNDPNWDLENVYWSTKRYSPLSYYINEFEFKNWLKKNNINILIFNEQRYWPPILWARELGVKTLAYVDYYTEETAPLYSAYDGIICNTKKHIKAISKYTDAYYIPWGTNIDLFKPISSGLVDNLSVTFFHSSGMNPYRKGTDLLIKSFYKIHDICDSKLIIHTQKQLEQFECFNELCNEIKELTDKNRLQVINETVSAPGLYHLGDIYVYPSRLDGLGLTVAEAISSGLGTVLTDDGPMNEFSNHTYSDLIQIEEMVSRKDGYYWPQAIININSLSEILLNLSNNKKQVCAMKESARIHAVDHLDWNKNSRKIFDILSEVKLGDIEYKIKTIEKAKAIDEKKYPKIHSIHYIYSFLYRLYKMIK